MKTKPILIAVLAVAGCSSSGTKTAPQPDPVAARKLIAENAVVIDVRTPEEFESGHVETAKNIPVDTISDKLPEVEQLVGGDKTKPIVVYCASGVRAAKATTLLEARGFTHVVDGGGYKDLH